MVGRTRRLFLLCLFGAFLVAGASGVRASAAPVDGGLIGGDGDDRAANTLTTATAVDQGYADGPNGTVFTMTTFETADGEQLTVKTHGGIRSDGVGQHTSHEARFTVGKTYRMPLSPSVDAEDQAGADGASGPIYRVVGGDRMVAELTASGEVVRDATPDNFVLLPFSWAWTLPDNPPVYLVNPNAPGVSNELSLVQQGFAKWEDDPGSSMDWTYGGTTGLTTVANDGNNTVFWANTPDPADDFLARATTFFNPNTGQAFDTDILFNNDFTWVDGAVAGAFDVMSVAIHESGHSLGLDHAPNNAAIMFFSISSGTVKRNLSLGDRGGVAAIYPPIVTGDTTVSGSVSFDGGGAGVSGVGIDLFTENRAAYLASTTTNSNGDYTLTIPGAGCYVITFIAPQGQTFTNESQYLNAPFCATAGQAVTGINAEVIAP
ncbi:MAG: matrixin family metalloprotease, partial [Actinomycetota bacterium]